MRLPAIPRWLRFAMVGGVNMVIDLALFIVLHYWIGWSPIAAHTGGFAVAVLNSYLMNKLWTFEDRDWSRRALRRALRFLLVAIGGLLLGAAVIAVSVPTISALAAKIIAIFATFAWNYTLSRLWVFDGPPSEPR